MDFYNIRPKRMRGDAAYAMPRDGITTGWDLNWINHEKPEPPMMLDLWHYDRRKSRLDNDFSLIRHIWLDFQPCALAWILFSQRLAEVVKEFSTDVDGLEWGVATIRHGSESRQYYVPRFPKVDVLDKEGTTWDSNHTPTRLCLSKKKVHGRAIFHCMEGFSEIDTGVIVNSSIWESLKRIQATGISFSKVAGI